MGQHLKLTSSVINIESRILPIAVLDPTPITTALALPATTVVPWQSKQKFDLLPLFEDCRM